MGNIQFDFSGKRALITGGGQGLGRKAAADFISSGAEVIVWERSLENIKRLEKDFSGRKLSAVQADVSSKESCEEAAARLSAKPIDFLINNAGILRDRSFAKMSWEEYESVIQTNLNGVFTVTKTLLNHFNPKSSSKRIVNLSSFVALYGNFGQSNYVAAKAGVIGLTKVWARELGRKGFTVNAIAPGLIQTDILKDMPQKTMEAFCAKIPVGRMGRPEDIAALCLFLCSEEASYVNGAVLEASGGAIV